jgi:hypothetical protein
MSKLMPSTADGLVLAPDQAPDGRPQPALADGYEERLAEVGDVDRRDAGLGHGQPQRGGGASGTGYPPEPRAERLAAT